MNDMISDMSQKKIPKPRGRPKRLGGYHDNVSTEYLELCRQGKSITQIAAHFTITEDELRSWAKDKIKRSKLATVWELGKTLCQAFHEDLLDQMIRATPRAAASEIASHQHRMAVMFKKWNLKNETKVTVTNKFEQMTDDELNKEVHAVLKRKINKELFTTVLDKTSDQKRTDTDGASSSHQTH